MSGPCSELSLYCWAEMFDLVILPGQLLPAPFAASFAEGHKLHSEGGISVTLESSII